MTRLDDIENRANAYANGPWIAHQPEGEDVTAVANPGGDFDYLDLLAYETSEFIAHARQDAPDLVAALRAVIDLHHIIRVEGAGGHVYEVCQTCNQSAPCAYLRAINKHIEILDADA